MANRKLNELDFVDLYVCLDADMPPHYNKLVSGQNVRTACMKEPYSCIEVPDDFKKDVDGLTAFLREKFVENEMGLTYEGVRLRAAKARTASGQLWASLRKINAQPPKIDKLGFTPALIPHLKNLGLRDGLIVVCGSTGQGKTTTSSSMLAHFLDNFGGVAFTIEDPVEYDLEGRHGKNGYCYQVEVQEDKEWAEMLKRSLRWHPRYIFVGEIRTPGAANQLLRAATSGHLVITTVHAGTIEEALEGLLQLAEQALGDRATNLLATGLAGIIHQTMNPLGLSANFYITEPHNPSSAFRSCIRDKRIGQTRTMIEQQSSLLMQSGKIFRDGHG